MRKCLAISVIFCILSNAVSFCYADENPQNSIVLAQYAENNMLKKIEISEETSSNSITTKNPVFGDYVKGILFKSMNNISPVMPAVTISDLPESISGSTDDVYFENNTSTLLSGNVTGYMFKEDSTVAAQKFWIDEGANRTDAGLIIGGLNKLTDGLIGNQYSTYSAESYAPAKANLVFDFNTAYKIDKVLVWTLNSAISGAQSIALMGSTDGVTYNAICEKPIKEFDSERIVLTELNLKVPVYARHLKIIINKRNGMRVLRIDEIAVYGSGAQSIALNGNYNWITEEPFPTKNDIASDTTMLTDGNYQNGLITSGKYATVEFDVGDCYQIGNIVVTADNMEGIEALFSVDGKKYFSTGYRTGTSAGVPGKNARYIKIIMRAKEGQSLNIKEIDIEGYPLYNSSAPIKDVMEIVPLSAYVKNYSTVFFDWSAYNHIANPVDSYAVYVEKEDFITFKGKKPVWVFETGNQNSDIYHKEKFCTYMGLEPNTQYYAAVAPIVNYNVANDSAITISFKTPAILDNKKVGSIFNINDFPMGGGANVPQPDPQSNFETKIKLLSHIDGINNSRWWAHESAYLSKYASWGINFHLSYNSDALDLNNSLGKWTYYTGNEPELKYPAEEFAQKIRENHSEMKSKNPNNMLFEPALMGTEAAWLSYLDDLYATGADFKYSFDVVDVHPYSKVGNQKPAGLEQLPHNGMPELLPQKIVDLKAIMSKNGDGDKPIVFTELGWSTFNLNLTPPNGVMYPQTQENQRNYLVRCYLLSIANDIKQVYWYAFQDEGPDYNAVENNFGIIDWYGKPKLAYYGYYTMSRILSDTEFIRTISGLATLNYAYEFWDESKNMYVTVLWTASGNNKPTVLSASGEIVVIGADYSIKSYNNSAAFTLTGMPVFVYSKTSLNISGL